MSLVMLRMFCAIQGGSSFNALVRAMKQQVVDTNTGERDPNLLFEINNMSMNKVQVFPDGELDIQARAERSNTAAFVQPTGAARAMHGRQIGSLAAPGRDAGTASPLHDNQFCMLYKHGSLEGSLLSVDM